MSEGTYFHLQPDEYDKVDAWLLREELEFYRLRDEAEAKLAASKGEPVKEDPLDEVPVDVNSRDDEPIAGDQAQQ